jgi:hypothetical protein
MNGAGAAGTPPDTGRKRRRRNALLAAALSCIVMAAVAGGVYIFYPRTVHFYAANDNPVPLNVTIEVDGATVINELVPAGANGVVGLVDKDVSLGGGFHSLKCSAPALNLSDTRPFSNFGGLYVLVDFQPDGIMVEFLDHAPLFM